MLFDLHDGDGYRVPGGLPYVSGMSTVLQVASANTNGQMTFTINGDMWGEGFPHGGSGGKTTVTMQSWITSPVKSTVSNLNYQSSTLTVDYLYWS